MDSDLKDIAKGGSEAGAAVAAALKFGESQVVTLDYQPEAPGILVVPEGRRVESVKKYRDEYAKAPDRRKGTAKLTTLDSFIDHTNRFKDTESAVFADVTNRAAPKMIAVFDYHLKGPDGKPRFGQHRGEYAFPVSDEWKAWTAQREPMTQEAFAEFLEERILDVMEPSSIGPGTIDMAARLGITYASPQRVMELSRGLTIRVGQQVSAYNNLSSGEAQIGFTEAHQDQAGGPLNVPGGFAIAIPVFRGGDAFTMAVRLRYRVKAGSISWSFAVQQIDKVWDTSVDEACGAVRQKTELPLFYGSPETA